MVQILTDKLMGNIGINVSGNRGHLGLDVIERVVNAAAVLGQEWAQDAGVDDCSSLWNRKAFKQFLPC